MPLTRLTSCFLPGLFLDRTDRPVAAYIFRKLLDAYALNVAVCVDSVSRQVVELVRPRDTANLVSCSPWIEESCFFNPRIPELLNSNRAEHARKGAMTKNTRERDKKKNVRSLSRLEVSAFLIALVLASGTVFPHAAVAAQAASLSLDPSSGPPGSMTQANGSGFANSPCGVNLFFDSTNGTLLAFASIQNGTFSVRLTIPANATVGKHTIIAQGLLAGVEFCDGPSGDEAMASYVTASHIHVGVSVPPIVMVLDLRTLPIAILWVPGQPINETSDEPEQIGTNSTPAAVGGSSLIGGNIQSASATDPVLSSPVVSFDGISGTGFVPPDTVGDVGPHHFIQAVNVQFSICDKSGNQLVGPSNINCIWRAAFASPGNPCPSPPSSVTDPCFLRNRGDADVKYDPLADRWLISQFTGIRNVPSFDQCIAISRTSDPVAGGWYLYDYLSLPFNDYPKFGVWPDAYYMGTNGGYGSGASDVWAFDRNQMLNGNSASFIRFDDIGEFMLPSDLDGSPPPPGAPNVFARMVDAAEFGGVDRLELREFHVDWANPMASTFTTLPDLPTSPFDRALCGLTFLVGCIPQPGTTVLLSTLSWWLMQRLQYRNFGTYETLVVNHSVDVDGTDRAGISWYELRKAGGVWSLYQQGTYSPDTTHRWMGSIAMNREGNIALGYSVSSSTVFPGIRYAGRLASDPIGTMPRGELTLIAGGGSQAFSCGNPPVPCVRWGDYSALSVDPTDDCTFWYTTEYYQSSTNWRTRIGSFRLGQCISVSKFFTDTSLNPLPTDQNGNPKVDVVLAGGVVRSTNPGEIIAWVNVTNTGGVSLDSLKLNDSLPVDWVVAPTWLPGKGAIHVFYANTTVLATNPQITDPKTITVKGGNPEAVLLAIPDLTATAIGHSLQQGQSILLGVKLDYGLDKTSQSAVSYPRNYTDTASAAAWTGASFTGTETTGSGSGFFIAYAKLLGDVNGDNKIDIVDVATVAYAYNTRPGDARWNANADLDSNGVVDINDVATVGLYWGTNL